MVADVPVVVIPGRQPDVEPRVLLDQAAMIQRVNLRTVPEEEDRADVTAAYEAVLAVRGEAAAGTDAQPVADEGGETGSQPSPFS